MIDQLKRAFAPGGPLAPLAAFPQFMLYRLLPGQNGKMTKWPMSPHTGAAPASVTDPANYADLQTALALLELYGPGYGLAFVFTAKDPFWFLDMDSCLDVEAGQWRPEVAQVLALVPGAAIEVSSSGQGLHAFFSGPAAGPGRRGPEGLELYSQERFVALTGNCSEGGSAAAYVDPAPLLAQYFPARASAGRGTEWTEGPVEEWGGPTDDDELIKRMLASKPSMAAGMGRAATPRQLWDRDVDALAEIYPSESGKEFNASAADQALANCLAWWTGKDCARIQRLMERSALARDKWEHHATYLENTILLACGGDRGVYPKPETADAQDMTAYLAPPQGETVNSLDVPTRSGTQLYPPTLQDELFKGCAYVTSINRIFMPNGDLLDQQRFNVERGGFLFMIEEAAGPKGKTTDKAWDAFTLSRCRRWPRVKATCFRPRLPTGAIVTIDGEPHVNTYVPVPVDRIPGDVSPFLDHVARLLPAPGDREILLAYLAGVVQYPGIKFRWAPVLQGWEGNGKGVFETVLRGALGMRYVHLAQASDIENKFNAWLIGRLLIVVNEVNTSGKVDVIDALKPMVTDPFIGVQAKGEGQTTAEVCANFFFTTNRKGAMGKAAEGRRYAIFHTAQQSKADLARDGLTGAYFVKLNAWLENGGQAALNYWLMTYSIPAHLNPAGECQIAPETSSYQAAVAEGLGSVEQEVKEAIESERLGFRGGFVSSYHLSELIRSLRKETQVGPAKRRELMQGLGYDWHPSLREGRSTVAVAVDGGAKSVLFVKKGSLLGELRSGREIADQYEKLQTGGNFGKLAS